MPSKSKTRKVFVAGNGSLCVTIPYDMRYYLGITENTEMDVSCVDGAVIYTPKKETLNTEYA